MKKSLFLIILFCLPVISFSQNINGRFSSSIYSFKRYDDSQNSYNHLRTYQTLQLNANYNKFSLKTRFNLEADVAEEMEMDPRLRFYNLYLEGRNLWNIATIKLGRHSIFTGPVNGLIDGASIKLKYSDYKFTAFYGGNVPAYQKFEIIEDWDNNYIGGAKLDAYILQGLHLAAGYVNKNFKSNNYYTDRLDANYNPVQMLIQKKSRKYQYVYGEADYVVPKSFDAHFKYNYDLNFMATSRIEFQGSYNKIENVAVSVYYNYRAPQIRYNSIFAVFDYANTHEVEAGLTYQIGDAYSVSGRFGNVIYKDDDAQRITAGFNTPYGSITYRKTLGYAGELDAISAYSAKSYFDGLITPSVGVSYTNYKLSADAEKNNLLTVMLGTNYRPLRNLSFDVQGQLLNNKIYNNDYRILFRLNHWFNANL